MGTHIIPADKASNNIMGTHITHADKASNNIFVFVYKSHDIDCLIMALCIGISSDNPTYSDDSNKVEILDNSFLYSSRNSPNMKHSTQYADYKSILKKSLIVLDKQYFP